MKGRQGVSFRDGQRRAVGALDIGGTHVAGAALVDVDACFGRAPDPRVSDPFSSVGRRQPRRILIATPCVSRLGRSRNRRSHGCGSGGPPAPRLLPRRHLRDRRTSWEALRGESIPRGAGSAASVGAGSLPRFAF